MAGGKPNEDAQIRRFGAESGRLRD
jgi:hypothetical protein